MSSSATEYDKKQDEEIKKLKDKVFGGTPPAPEEECGPNPDPNNEHVKPGGWGGDTASADTWESVAMKDPPDKWKVVDKAGVNIAHNFASEADADKYIQYHQCAQEQLDEGPTPPGAEVPTTPPPTPTPTPPPTESAPKPPTTGGGAGPTPYATKGNPMQSTQRGPTTRHYASGAPDDETIEKNVKNITFDNYVFVVDVTINKMEHDDSIALKLGGTHMGSGWFDNTVGIYTGYTCLGTEPQHPTTKACLIKGPKIGDIRNKPIRIASSYFKKTNKTELWTDFGASGWKKQCEGTNVGNFNPKSAINEAQLRIDGFTKGSVPTIRSALVWEIAAQG